MSENENSEKESPFIKVAEAESSSSEQTGGKPSDHFRWYVIHVYSGYEKKVANEYLPEHIRTLGLEDRFGEILVPTEEIVEMRGGQKRKSERKFFPGYVLAKIDMDDELWHVIKDVPKVLGFIGGKKGKPAPITEKEADAILQRMQEGIEKPRPKFLYEPGELVRVIDGPFKDFSGVVDKVEYEKNHLWVALSIFGRTTPVELDFNQVEKG